MENHITMEHGIKKANIIILCLICLLLSACRKEPKPNFDAVVHEMRTDGYKRFELETMDVYYYENRFYYDFNFNADGYVPDIELELVIYCSPYGDFMGFFTVGLQNLQGATETYKLYTQAKQYGTHYEYTKEEIKAIEDRINAPYEDEE